MGFLHKLAARVEAPKATVAVLLDKPIVSVRDPLTGKIQVTSYEEFDIDEIRLEIKVHEWTRATQRQNLGGIERDITSEMQNPHHNSEVTLQTGMHVTNGFRQEYPFSVNLPAGLPPTYRGINATNAWYVKSVAAVRGRPDIVGHETEVQVTG